MIPMYKFLYGVGRRASSQVLLSSHSIRLAKRVSSFSSNIDPTLPTERTPSKAVTCYEFTPEEGKIDLLEECIKAATAIDQILRIVERHAVIMDNDHLLGCIKKLADLPTGGIFSESLADSDSFQIALDTIAQRVKSFDGGELVELIFCLSKLQVPPNARVIEEICSELQFKLSDHTVPLQDLPLLIRTLRKMSTPFKHLLIHPLHVAIQFRVRQELDVEDSNSCVRFFNYILRNETDRATADFIAEAALRSFHSVSYATAVNVLYLSCLDAAKYDKREMDSTRLKVKEVLTVCLKIAFENMNSMSELQLRKTMRAMKKWRIGTDEFFTALWNRSSELSTEDLLELLKASSLNEFMSLSAANQIVVRYLNQQDEIASLLDSEFKLCGMATAIATSVVHTDPGSDENERALKAARLLMDFVVEQGKFFNSSSDINLVDFLTQMCVCGVYSWRYIDQVFRSTSQERNSSSYGYLAELIKLEELIAYKLKDSSKYAVRPENSILLLKTLHWLSSTLRIKMLENCIRSFANYGNKKCIRSLVQVSGLKISFIVAFDRNGTPLEIPGELRGLVCVEELPPGSKIVAIMRDSKSRFSSGLTRPFCEWKMKCLRDEGFCPVTLTYSELHEAILATRIQQALREGPVYRNHESSAKVYQSVPGIKENAF